MRNVATLGLVFGIGLFAAACRVDMNIGDWINDEYLPDPGPSSGQGTSGSAGQAGSPPVAPECIDQEQGSSTSCKDVASWKQYASADCESSGGELADYSTREACGEGFSRFVDYTCCPKAAPQADPAPTDCTMLVQGGDTSCQLVALWKQYASADCESSGGMLTDYSPREECGKGLYRYVDYTCCPQPDSQPAPQPDPQPVPQPANCTNRAQGGGDTSCQLPALWKQYASADCESSGGALTNYLPREECGKGLYRYVDYTCCP